MGRGVHLFNVGYDSHTKCRQLPQVDSSDRSQARGCSEHLNWVDLGILILNWVEALGG